MRGEECRKKGRSVHKICFTELFLIALTRGGGGGRPRKKENWHRTDLLSHNPIIMRQGT